MPDMTSLIPMASPEEAGFSSDRLKRIKPVIERYISKGVIPGASMVIARNGKLVYKESYGLSEIETEKPMTDETIFRIASMTKPIASVALMMLFEEGYFLLSDPISKFLPEFSEMKVAVRPANDIALGDPLTTVPADRPITFQHILTHTAGLANIYRGPNTDAAKKLMRPTTPDGTIGDFVTELAKIPLNNHPGAAWEYSRSTCVVGRLVEVISGATLDEFLKERIFGPLGMVDTHFFLPEEKIDRFAACYTPGPDLKIKLTDAPGPESWYVKKPHLYYMGSGGLVSTISDYLNFNQMMLNQGEFKGTHLLGRKTVELMTRNHIGDLPIWLVGPYMGFGLGYGIAKDISSVNGLKGNQPGPAPWSPGSYTWGGAFCTYSWIDPAENLTGIIMTQVRPYGHLNLRHDFMGLTYQALVD